MSLLHYEVAESVAANLFELRSHHRKTLAPEERFRRDASLGVQAGKSEAWGLGFDPIQ